MTQICIVRWSEGDSYFEDHKIIGKDIPMEIALQMVENGDAEIQKVEDPDFTEDAEEKWVTIHGIHILIKPGEKLVWGKGGKYKRVKKGEATKEKKAFVEGKKKEGYTKEEAERTYERKQKKRKAKSKLEEAEKTTQESKEKAKQAGRIGAKPLKGIHEKIGEEAEKKKAKYQKKIAETKKEKAEIEGTKAERDKAKERKTVRKEKEVERKQIREEQREERRQIREEKARESVKFNEKKKEDKISALVEKTGYTRLRAKEELIKTDPAFQKEEAEKKAKVEIKEAKQKEITNEIKTNLNTIKKLDKGKSFGEHLGAIIELTANILAEANKPLDQMDVTKPIINKIKQIKKDKKLSKKQKDQAIEKIKKLEKSLLKLQEANDFTVNKVGNIFDDFTFTRVDRIDMDEFTLKHIITDFDEEQYKKFYGESYEDFLKSNQDFTVLNGPITREGDYRYIQNGKEIIFYKKWDNLKEVFGKTDYIPLIGTKDVGAHSSEIIGFSYNFKPDEKTKRIFADTITFDDMDLLSDLVQPDTKWQISIGFNDHIEGNQQIIDYVDHLAISLNNLEKGRCGELCFMKKKEVNA